ncbi:MAG TPA: hypothetical protein VK348_13585 [Planctomycetota bacterium]|nr:hypothetical protein [Planctomycetota bacterium]
MDFDPATLFTGLLVSSVGFSLLLYGKKQGRVPQLIVGGLLTVVPLVVSNPWLLAGGAVLVIAGLWLAVRAGH